MSPPTEPSVETLGGRAPLTPPPAERSPNGAPGDRPADRRARKEADDLLPDPAHKQAAVQEMFDRISPRYERVNRILTFSLDRRWRQAAVGALGLGPEAVVLDLACGTGDLLRLARASGLRPIGADLSAGMLARVGRHFPLLQAAGEALPLGDESVDGAISGFALRNFVDLSAALRELARVIRPGGPLALLDVATPENSILRLGHHLYFDRVVPIVGGLLSDRAAYRYLPRSVTYLPEPGKLRAMLAEAGFESVHRRLLGGGAAQLLVANRSDGRFDGRGAGRRHDARATPGSRLSGPSSGGDPARQPPAGATGR